MSEHVDVPRYVAGAREGRIDKGVCLVRCLNPNGHNFDGTNTWIIGEPNWDGCVVIDPSQDVAGHFDRVLEIATRQGRRIVAVLITHRHRDHVGDLADFVQRAGNPVVYAPAAPEAELSDPGSVWPGEVSFVAVTPGPLPIEGFKAPTEVVSLKGHSADQVGYVFPSLRAAATGDTVFAHSSTALCWPGGTLGDYFASLRLLGTVVSQGKAQMLLPGHGDVICNPTEVLERARRNKRKRLDQVVASVMAGMPATAEAVVDALYNDVGENLRDVALTSANAQLQYAFETGLLQR